MGRRRSLIPTTSQMSCLDVEYHPDLEKRFLDDLARFQKQPAEVDLRKCSVPRRVEAPEQSSGMSSPASWH